MKREIAAAVAVVQAAATRSANHLFSNNHPPPRRPRRRLFFLHLRPRPRTLPVTRSCHCFHHSSLHHHNSTLVRTETSYHHRTLQ
uniref:Putative secreted peptide n=1 Tax=Anopheles braziliensis TaxID=58242 RepID=A0A2M3ZQY3_9DIPT